MDKPYKISYKTYLNDRLKEVYLHGKMTYPLYVQLTFDRRTIFFKSYYFELFSKSRFMEFVPGVPNSAFGPTIEAITAKEYEVIEYIINKHPSDFSLELFKTEYAFYSKDLCDVTEKKFVEYLHVFFLDKGMQDMAIVINEGIKFRVAYQTITRDIRKAFNPKLYEELIDNSFYYAPPYLPLYGFMQQRKKWPMISFAVMEWEKEDIKADFVSYIHKTYPKQDANDIVQEIDGIVKYLKAEPA